MFFAKSIKVLIIKDVTVGVINRTAGAGRGYHSALAALQVLIAMVRDRGSLIKTTAGAGRGWILIFLLVPSGR